MLTRGRASVRLLPEPPAQEDFLKRACPELRSDAWVAFSGRLVLELAEAALSAGDPPLGPEARQNRAAWLKAADRPLSPDVRAAAEDLWDACRAYFLCCFAVALTCPPHPARRLVAGPAIGEVDDDEEADGTDDDTDGEE